MANRNMHNENSYAIITMTIEGLITAWNNGAEQMFGYPSSEAVNKRVGDLIILSEEREEEQFKLLETVNSETYHYGSIHRRRDGSLIYVLVSNRFVDGANGSLPHVISTRKDVTRTKAMHDSRLVEARYAVILESVPDGMLMINATGNIIFVNSQLERLFGYSPAELKGQTIEVLLPERFRIGHIIHRLKYADHPHSRPMGAGLDLYGLRKDGSEIPVEVSLSPITLEGTTLIMSTIRDISERKRAELALRQSEERFRRLITDVEDYAIFMLDPNGNVASWNAGAQKIKGYASEEIIGKHFSLFYVREDIKEGKPQKALELALKNGRCEDEGWRVRKDKTRFWADVIITALRDEQGSVIGFTKVTRDRSEQRKAEDEIKERSTQLATANKELEAFSYSVSHDLRAPLRAVDGFSRMLIEDYAALLDDEAKRRLEVIRHNVQNMGELIDDLLEFSRIGRRELNESTINMTSLARDVFEELKAAAIGRTLEVIIHDLPAAKGDFKLIRQVMVNLVSNAIKFTGKKPSAEIEIGFIPNDGEYIYFVKDDGAGFDERYADKLFGVFQRLHTTKEFDGTGVGLAIVQRIIHRHHGRVWAKGKTDVGATFYFSLPKKGSLHGT